MKLSKEFNVKVIEAGSEPENTGEMQVEGGENQVKEYRIIPHKIIRMPANAYR